MPGIEISALPAAPSAQLTDVFPIDQLPGPVTYKLEASQLLTLFINNSGFVESVTGSANEIDVDNTDPQNPVLSLPNTLILGDITATSITFNPSTGGIVGTTAVTNASAGFVGEYISSSVNSGGAVALTTTVSTNITSIVLTAGDWDVYGSIAYFIAATTVNAARYAAISSISATLPTIPNGGAYLQSPISITGVSTFVSPLGSIRVVIAVPTTFYLVARADFTTSTCSAYGFIGARRRR